MDLGDVASMIGVVVGLIFGIGGGFMGYGSIKAKQIATETALAILAESLGREIRDIKENHRDHKEEIVVFQNSSRQDRESIRRDLSEFATTFAAAMAKIETTVANLDRMAQAHVVQAAQVQAPRLPEPVSQLETTINMMRMIKEMSGMFAAPATSH